MIRQNTYDLMLTDFAVKSSKASVPRFFGPAPLQPSFPPGMGQGPSETGVREFLCDQLQDRKAKISF